MNLKFTFQSDITDEQIAICYDYYCPSSNNYFDLLEHIINICHAHQITLKQLNKIIKKSRVYDPTICCQQCNIMYKIDEPYIKPCNHKTHYYCHNCRQFIAIN